VSELRVALTFDAEHPDRPWCPPGNAERILDVLTERGVRATFFIQGRWAESFPDTARRIAKEGHLVGHHSKYHARMTLLSDDGIRADVREGEAAILAATGADPHPWFRCPFGDGRDDPRVRSALAELGYRDIGWNVVVEDWEPWREGSAIAGDAVAAVRDRGDGAVVLLHTWPGGTGDAVGPIVHELAGRGASFVGVDELEALS
jgi:peptidoglycan/xylan/chitin deacetylase (PgdA/CDA1 family)